MKKILLILVALIGFGIMVNAQDVILKQDGSEIKAKVTEITDQQIKYKDFDFQSGPTRNINISEVFMITYENGQKEVFRKHIETKEVSALEAANVSDTESNETVYLPESMQSRKDVIVKVIGGGFQARITNIDSKYIFYLKSKKSGKEVDKKIKQKKIAYTYSFNEKAKQELYPSRMNAQEYLSLPVYFDKHMNWYVFGTNGMHLLALRKLHPDIYNNYTEGKELVDRAWNLRVLALAFCWVLPVSLALSIPANVMTRNGVNKINKAVVDYHAICVKLETRDKYGIIITPYQLIPSF